MTVHMTVIPWDSEILPLTDSLAESAIGRPVTHRDRVVGRITGAYAIEGRSLTVRYELDEPGDGYISLDVSGPDRAVLCAAFIPHLRVVS